MTSLEIAWPLVLFTTISSAGAWLIAILAFLEIRKTGLVTKEKIIISAVAIVLLGVGGLCSVAHLSHPERVFALFGHPTMGIFVEAAFIGVLVVLMVAYVLCLVRNVDAKVSRGIIVVAGIAGILFSFMSGYSYMMPSRELWNTLFLPLGYAGTSSVTGALLFVALAALRKYGSDYVDFGLKAVCVLAAVSALTACLYGLTTGTAFSEPAIFFGLVIALGALVPAVAALLLKKAPNYVLVASVCCFVLAMVGSGAYRVLMWVSSQGTNYFMTIM